MGAAGKPNEGARMIAELQTAIVNSPVRRPVDHKLTDADRLKVRTERMALLLRSAPTAIFISALNAAITTVVAWTSIDRTMLLVWAGLVLVLAAVRLGVWLRFRRAATHGLTTFARFNVAAMAL